MTPFSVHPIIRQERDCNMKFIIKKSKPFKAPLINKAEETFNIKFPKALKNYYSSYGNSQIKTCQFKIDGFLYDVSAFVSIDINDPASFYKIMEYGRSDGWIPNNFYPFAHDSGGNYYFWNSVNQRIYLIFNDDVEYPYEICASIKDFFKIMEGK